jgi:Smg protein
MNEVIEVLMYLFEKHMNKDCYLAIDDEHIAEELSRQGFKSYAINKALDWLQGLAHLQEQVDEYGSLVPAIRVYSSWEMERLDRQCRGFIHFLEITGILTAFGRELVIDRLMALDIDRVDLAEVKWVTLMVLFNQPNKDAALACMERLVLQEELGRLH